MDDLTKFNRVSTRQKSKKRANSTSSIRITSTIDNPNIILLIRSISNVLLSNIQDDVQDDKIINPNSDLEYFSEEKYIKQNPNNYDEDLLRKTPTVEEVSKFIEVKFYLNQLGFIWPWRIQF